ncbi:MAG: class I SAM-dependent methyltransferase, partial [Clostridiales bacterium]|nr:class I SAM-dependent methyltransferase [Clostridiales bacterium]
MLPDKQTICQIMRESAFSQQLNRNIVGVDINPIALARCREKTMFDYSDAAQVYIKQGDARNLAFIPSESVDFICTHPPYADIIHCIGRRTASDITS